MNNTHLTRTLGDQMETCVQCTHLVKLSQWFLMRLHDPAPSLVMVNTRPKYHLEFRNYTSCSMDIKRAVAACLAPKFQAGNDMQSASFENSNVKEATSSLAK